MKQVRMYRVELVRESSKLYDFDTDVTSSTKAQMVIKEVLQFEKWHNEKFGILCLNAQNKLVGVHIVSEGTINEAPVYTREVAVRALLNNASSVIAFHNHPGESLSPSKSDLECTQRIKEGLATLNIRKEMI